MIVLVIGAFVDALTAPCLNGPAPQTISDIERPSAAELSPAR